MSNISNISDNARKQKQTVSNLSMGRNSTVTLVTTVIKVYLILLTTSSKLFRRTVSY
jgi:hypothetical protein